MTLTVLPPRMKGRYKVAVHFSDWSNKSQSQFRYFTYLDKAEDFAARQAAKTWGQTPWTVVDRETGDRFQITHTGRVARVPAMSS